MNRWIYYMAAFFILSAVLIKVFKSKIFTPKLRGWLGEARVAAILFSLPQKYYKVLNNVMLKTERGSTQIDHVIVSVYGIFVIETKNFKGKIYGEERSKLWEMKNKYGKKYPFQNPLNQNFGHVKALEKLLKLPQHFFIPIVVFSMRANLKVKTDTLLVYTVKLKKTIRSFSKKKLDITDLDKLVEKISAANIDSKKARKEHVAMIHKTIAKNNQPAKICPRCGGSLIQRKGKYGAFVGCSKYPQCRYTKKTDNHF